jgi:M6 family metalloprotease-like protein
MAYYGENDSDDFDKNPWDLAREAALFAFNQPGINPEDYDNDGDGYIDAFHIIYAGYGEEAGGGINTIWAHESWVTPITFGNKKFSVYSCSPELRNSSGSSLTHIGVICHEMGHVFGAPDFYDVDGSEGGEFLGTGNWDLMAGGSWNGVNSRDGSCPAHMNMYLKIGLGWVDPIILDITHNNSNINMENSAKNPVACIFNTPVAGEYYVLENRQKEGFDSGIPGTGLLIYHVSLNEDDFYNNEVNNSHPQKMYPVCASAIMKLPGNSASSYGSINSGGCPFPGTSGKTSFTDLTTPASLTWNEKKANGFITDIREQNSVISFSYTHTGTDIKLLPSNETEVHPNPVQSGEFVTIDTGNHSGNGILSVYTISGQKLTEEHFTDKIIRKKMDLTPGVYILQIQKNRQVTNRKIVVK